MSEPNARLPSTNPGMNSILPTWASMFRTSPPGASDAFVPLNSMTAICSFSQISTRVVISFATRLLLSQ